ncbi:MAG: FeoB-associated Cys-rich membrane protein [Arcobacteraceae bacterium]
MEEIIITVVALLALYYIYRRVFKKSGCGCGGTGECDSKKNQ